MSNLRFIEKIYLLGPIFLIFGIFLTISIADRILKSDPPLELVGVPTLSLSGEKGWGGSWLFIEVDGERYRCAGENLTGPWRGIEVLYHRENPAHCREASIVENRPTSSEWIALAISLQFLVLGTFILRSLIIYHRRKREEKERLLQELGL